MFDCVEEKCQWMEPEIQHTQYSYLCLFYLIKISY